MKKFILISILLLNLLPTIENGSIKTCITKATAQIMGTEQYDCEDEMGPYQSSFPCETEACVTPCPICKESMPCELYEGHAYVQHSDESQKEVTKEEDDFPSGEESGGGGGAGGNNSSGNTGGNKGYNPGSTATFTHKTTATKITSSAKSTVSSIPGTDAQCSEGVRRLFKKIYGSLPNGMNCQANAMVKYWQNSSSWGEIQMSQAQGYANQGYFVVAGWINPRGGSGHVVVIVPGFENKGSSWGNVPNAMDTGRDMRTASQPLNYSFGEKKRPNVKFFIYK